MTNSNSEQYVSDADGVLLGVRRRAKRPVWTKILGKTLPDRYPLINHLVDTMAVAHILWEQVLSDQQKRMMTNGFTFEESIEDSQSVVKDFVLTAAGLHDIGKAHPHWQRNTLKMNPDDDSLLDETSGQRLSLVDNAVEAYQYHQINGAAYFLLDEGSCITAEPVQQALSTIVRGHHGTFAAFGRREPYKSASHFLPEGWKESQHLIERQVLDSGGINLQRLSKVSNISQESVVLITGVVILADWIASRADFINAMDAIFDPKDHYQKACSRAQAFVSIYGIEKPLWKDITWRSVFPSFANPNPLQGSLVQACGQGNLNRPGLLLINAPMGSGKTEASLFVASHLGAQLGASGIWMSLPTQATSDAIFNRAVEITEKIYKGSSHGVSLLHANSAISTAVEAIARKDSKLFAERAVSFNELIDDGKDASGSNLFISEFLVEKKLGGMSPMSIGTIDQLINASTRLKHNALRWLAISGKVLIMDEIHDFDEYTFALIKRCIQWCGAYGVPVIAMSATLSGQSQRDLVQAYHSHQFEVLNQGQRSAYGQRLQEFIPDAGLPSPSWLFATTNHADPFLVSDPIESDSYPLYQLALETVTEFTPRVIELTQEHLNNDASVLVVCHTVNQAIATYRVLKDAGLDAPVGLLHSRMTQTRKQEVIAEMLKSTGKPKDSPGRHKQVLVSTQIVQQSMDIDFDVLITPLAPLPELFQRVGRIHRHDQQDRRAPDYEQSPRIHILVHEEVSRSVAERDEVTLSTEAKASLIPYTEWSLLSSLKVLRGIAPTQAHVFWDAKGTMASAFADHADLQNDVIAGRETLPSLVNAWKQHLQEIKQKQSRGDFAAIAAPSVADFILPEITADFTARSSKASATRLIQETVSLLPLYPQGSGKWSLDPQGHQMLPLWSTVDFMRKVGLSCINVSTRFASKYFEPITTIDRNIIPEYITPFDASTMNDEVALDEAEGLTIVSLEAGPFIWL